MGAHATVCLHSREVLEELQDFFNRYKDEVENKFSDWSRLYMGFRHDGYLSTSSLQSLGTTDQLDYDVKLENDRPFALALSYSRTLSCEDQFSVARQVQDMCRYLFRDARYRFYLRSRIDMAFYKAVVGDGIPLSLVPFWRVFRSLYPFAPGKQVEQHCNDFFQRAIALPGGDSLRLFSHMESCSLAWLRQTAEPAPDEIFLGYALIREFFFDALPDSLHMPFQKGLEQCVNHFFIAHGLGY